MEKETWWEKSKQASKQANPHERFGAWRRIQKALGSLLTLQESVPPPHAHSLSLSLHRQIDFAITFKFSQESKVLQKTTQNKLSQTLSRCYEKATPSCSVKKKTLSEGFFFLGYVEVLL